MKNTKTIVLRAISAALLIAGIIALIKVETLAIPLFVLAGCLLAISFIHTRKAENKKVVSMRLLGVAMLAIGIYCGLVGSSAIIPCFCASAVAFGSSKRAEGK